MHEHYRRLIPYLPFIMLAAAAFIAVWHLISYH
jgi:hypothetical protein